MSLPLLIFITSSLLSKSASGAFLTPTAYTLPGVMAVNGSNANGGCLIPCVGVAGGITTCDCGTHSTLGAEAITGVLIDGVMPTIDTAERNMANEFVWAAPLFTIRGDTITLGFQFSERVVLQEVELYLFHCPAWGIRAGTIRIFNGATFPLFTPGLFSSIGSVTLASDEHNCDSLTRVPVPLQMVLNTQTYFIEFTNPSGDQIEWVHIAEVRFSDESITTSMVTTNNPTTELITTMSTEMPTTAGETTQEATSIAPSTSFGPTDEDITTDAEGISEPILPSSSVPFPDSTSPENIPLIPIPTSSLATDLMLTPSSSLVYTDTVYTTHEVTPSVTSSRAPTATTSTNTTDQVLSVTTTPPTQRAPFPLAVVGAVMGVVIVLLILLIATGVTIVCFYKRHRRSYKHKEGRMGADHPLVTTSTTSFCDPVSACSNSPNQETQFGGLTNGAQFPPLISTIPREGRESKTFLPEVDTAKDVNSIYDAVTEEQFESQYSTIENCMEEREEALQDQETKKPAESGPAKSKSRRKYSLVKKTPPVVPDKSPELRRTLLIENAMQHNRSGEGISAEGARTGLREGEGVNPLYVSSDDVRGKLQEEPATYSVLRENCMPALVTTSTSLSSLGGYNVIQIQDEDDEDDEDYTKMKGNVRAIIPKRHVTSGPVVLTSSICKGLEVNPEYQSADELMIAMEEHKLADAAKDTESIVNVVYDRGLELQRSVIAAKTKDNSKSVPAQLGEESEAEGCEPIYSLISSSEDDDSGAILEFKPDNIRKVRTLGAGFFGKVILAETVGLSLKQLGLSDTDDDKGKSLRVAVKLLRQNPSPDRREAFNKELKFMSHLNHPNVICALGACTKEVSSPFIVMEYMEKGDLNQYLQNFDNIVHGNAPPTHLTISVGTLVYMSAQIANAMKYLASRNYIHRDLATRNCLVGEESRIKIADFGMSKNLYRSHYYFMSAHAILPIRWMAKECFYGKFSAKTDVWAFGVTMWEIFTLGKDIPYEDMDDSEVVADASDERNRQLLKRPKDCPEEIYTIMLSCWKEEPKDRANFDKLHEVLSRL